MDKKLISLLLCMCLFFSVSSASASARMPECRGLITDDANALSAEIASAVLEKAKTIESDASITVNIVFVHFLDGMSIQSYSDALFTKWNLADNGVLFVIAAGEDSCAVSIGTKAAGMVGKANVDNLLITESIATAVEECRYDDCVVLFLNAFIELCNRQTGSKIQPVETLQTEEEASSVQSDSAQNDKNFISTMWDDLHQNTKKNQQQYAEYTQEQENDNGLSAGEWILLAILVLIIFTQANKERKIGRDKQKRHGCGCSPIGWIISLLGLGGAFTFIRRKK